MYTLDHFYDEERRRGIVGVDAETYAQIEAHWDALCQTERPRLVKFFLIRTGDETLAEDLAADTFMEAWRCRERYNPEAARFSTWLFTIARRAAIDAYRARRVQVPLDVAEDLSEVREEGSLADPLLGMVDNLSPRQRQLVLLKYEGGYTNRQIARMLGLSESNVGTILHRAMTALRAHLHAEEAPPL